MEEILISKKQCEWIDDGWHRCWKVEMPDTAPHAGYAFEVSDYLLSESENPQVLRLRRPVKDGFLFILKKIPREPGQRYARPKLTWQDLCSELSEHSAGNDKTTLQQGLAFIYDYDYDRGFEVGREGHYAVGGIERCWFWENGTKRRRSSAKNFRLLRLLRPEEVAGAQQAIARLQEIDTELYRLDHIERDFGRVKWDIDHTVQVLQSAADAFLAQVNAAREHLKEEQAAIVSGLERE